MWMSLTQKTIVHKADIGTVAKMCKTTADVTFILGLGPILILMNYDSSDYGKNSEPKHTRTTEPREGKDLKKGCRDAMTGDCKGDPWCWRVDNSRRNRGDLSALVGQISNVGTYKP